MFLVKFQKGTKDSNLRARRSASQEYSLFLSERGNQGGFSFGSYKDNEKIMLVLIICILTVSMNQDGLRNYFSHVDLCKNWV